MLTAMKLTGTPEALAIYHSGEENYYYKQAGGMESVDTDSSSPPSPEYVRVYGNLCPELDLKSGSSIDERTFTNLLYGKDSSGVQRTRKHKVHGIDLTFSAPKTVSIAGLITEKNPLITKAHDDAVLETMKEIEARHSFARPTSDTKIETNRMVYVIVRDGLSRELDPHLHSHAIIMNITKGPKTSDKIMGLHMKEILRVEFNKVWGAVYRNKLSAKLRKIGYEISYTKKGMWRLDKVSHDAENEFSQRHKDIVREKAKGKLDMAAWRNTRKEKQPDSWSRGIQDDWQERVSRLPERNTEQNKHNAMVDRTNWSKKAIWSIEAKQEREHKRLNITEAQTWQLAVRRATEKTATVSRHEIITEYLAELARKQTWKPMSYLECSQRLTEQITMGNLIQVEDERITSWEMIVADREAVQRQLPVTGRQLPVIAKDTEEQLNNYQKKQEQQGKKTLSDIQKQAVKKILTNTNAITIVQGDAGSGKTTALRAVNAMCKTKNIKITGLAMQGVAARNLENESGIKSQTLASFLSQHDRSTTRPHATEAGNRLIIVDEASMLDSRNTAKLIETAKSNGDRLILVGDRNQLESIGAGKPFDRLVDKAEEDNTLISLSENYRQKDPVLREAVDLARKGNMVESLELLDRAETITEIDDDTERRKTIAGEYSPDTLIITATISARDNINSIVREDLIERGQLNDKIGITFIMDRFDEDGIEERNRLRLTTGDRITFLRNEYREYDVRNGERAEVTGLTAGKIKVKMEDGRNMTIDTKKYRAIDYGYALTTYKAQGLTYNKVIIESDTKIPKLNDMRNQYVQITRARNKVMIFTDDKEELKYLADVKTHSRDTLDERITLNQAEKGRLQMEQRIRTFVEDRMKDFMEGRTTIPPSPPSRIINIRNNKVLDKYSKADWMRSVAEKAMQKTTEKLNKRTDLTREQKDKIEKFLNGDRGMPVWSKQSLTPDGRIAAVQLLSGDKDREKVLKGIPHHEKEVIKTLERNYYRYLSKEKKDFR